MSESVSALGGVSFDGYVRVAEQGPQGMIVLRSKGDGLAEALAALGLPVPGQRRIEVAGDRAVAWMSPDEVLIWLPYAEVPQAVQALGATLAGKHHLVADVSDARAVFTVTGPGAREVLAKACPVDFAPAAFGPGEVRRTRAAQVAAAVWMSGEDTFTLVCFRSVARYVFDLLSTLARPGAEVGLYR
jgi:sarcosine oxidase, subunit gamma